MKPRALDLFCCAGGATKGLQRAGFHVTGVDIRPQPRYCGDEFLLADALDSGLDLAAFDFIWASPPCQRFSAVTRKAYRDDHPDLIEPTRRLLAASGAVTVMENVPAAPLRRDVALDGDMFGLGTYRRRIFETNFLVLSPPQNRPFGPESRPGSVTVTGGGNSDKVRIVDEGGRTRLRKKGTTAQWRVAMGIDWMTCDQLAEAIPPAYSEFIGRAALAYLRWAA